MTFPGFDPPPSPPEKPLSRGRRRTIANNAALARGINPGSGLEVIANKRSCGQCWHAIARDGRGGQMFWKCELGRLSASEATDIRLSWPACRAYSAKDDGKSHAPAWITRASERRR